MKLFKKLASFILAFAMVMAIAMPSVVMAADNGSITITGANAGHTFEAYQIFAGEVSGKTLSNLKWGNGVNEDGRNKLGSAKVVGHAMEDTADIEAILGLNPDLIIMAPRQEKIYEQLKEIAPVVMLDDEYNDW